MHEYILRWGYWAVLAGGILESEAILTVAGAMAHHGLLSLPLVIGISFVGAVSGTQGFFWLGRRAGLQWISQRPYLLSQINRLRGWIDRTGVLFLIGFRFIYGIRTLAPLFFGSQNYPARRFFILNLLGAAIWNLTFALLGWGVGASLQKALGRSAHVRELVIAGVLIVAGLAVFLFWRSRRRGLPNRDKNGRLRHS